MSYLLYYLLIGLFLWVWFRILSGEKEHVWSLVMVIFMWPAFLIILFFLSLNKKI